MEDIQLGKKNMNIYIIGGGITGLNLAREFSKMSMPATLYEASDRFGGLAGYTTCFGRNLDLGPHIYHTPDEDIKNYLLESLPNCFFERTHWAKNLKNNRYYDYPVSKEFIDSLDKETREKINYELKNSDPEQVSKAKTYKEYINALAGETLTELFFTDYPKKLWGMDTSKLDANWAPKRVQIREKKLPFFANQWSAVGKDGTSTIVKELIHQCDSSGASLNLNSKVDSIKIDSGFITEISVNNKPQKILPTDYVINTSSLTKLSEIHGVRSKVRYRGVYLVYIHTTNLYPFPDSADFIYVDDHDISFNRVSDQNTFVENPNTESTVLCCEITYEHGDELDNKKSSVVENTVQKDLIKLGLLKENQILGSSSLKLPEVYPMFELNYRENLNQSLSELTNLSNFYNLGSLAEFAYSDLQILFAKSRDLAQMFTSKTLKYNKVGVHKVKPTALESFKFLGKSISDNSPCFNIAEIGLNHNGSMERAKELVNIAKEAGFDAVKFQTYNAEGRSSSTGKTSKYVEKVLQTDLTDFEMFSQYQLSHDHHKEIIQYCNNLDIPFFSAPFDIESAQMLDELGVEAYKIASMELTNLDLISKVAKLGKPMILSSGMATLSDIEDAISAVVSAGNNQVALLHCTSVYPAPSEAINLKAIDTLKKAFKIPVGFSDHYHDDTMSIASIVLGAKIIEKHVTLDKKLEGPDHALSLDPDEQFSFIKRIKAVENGIGDGVKFPSREELKSEMRFKKSLYFKEDFKTGHKLKEDDFVSKAPCFGILPRYKEIVIGSILTKDAKANEPITLDYIDANFNS
jgi:N,N'-diacetyllegionaminate synthase